MDNLLRSHFPFDRQRMKKMRAYVIAEIQVTNPEGYKAYTTTVPATIEQYGGRFLVRGGKAETLEGEWPERRRVVIEFPSVEAAKKWWDSSEYAQPKALRRAHSEGRLLLLEGVA
jgi:uncharacterized protein (DUF1330 family)